VASMTPRARYRALNEQVMRLRHGRPLRLDIEGVDTLHLEHDDVMLEAPPRLFRFTFRSNRTKRRLFTTPR